MDQSQHELDKYTKLSENVFRKTKQALSSWIAKNFGEHLQASVESDPWLCGKSWQQRLSQRKSWVGLLDVRQKR